MKHKVSELEGALLDAAVARAEGLDRRRNVTPLHVDHEMRVYDSRPAYSTDWAHGGPIVEREWRGIRCALESRHGDLWPRSIVMSAPTTLGTFMRAYVTSKFGDEIELG